MAETKYDWELKLDGLKLGLKLAEKRGKRNVVISVLIGHVLGCATMFITHKDIYHHYNVCQESQLLDSISRIGDEKSWYIKEDAFGKIKLVQLSNREIDSLNHK